MHHGVFTGAIPLDGHACIISFYATVTCLKLSFIMLKIILMESLFSSRSRSRVLESILHCKQIFKNHFRTLITKRLGCSNIHLIVNNIDLDANIVLGHQGMVRGKIYHFNSKSNSCKNF